MINGNYTVSSLTTGYNNASILPATLEIVEGTNDYSFTVAATGTLTIHVSDDGTDVGVPIVGAKFVRCDANGQTYGNEVVSDADGNATFAYVPFATENAPLVYYKQTASDGNHDFNSDLQNTTLLEQTVTIELENEIAATRNFNLTDTNYSGLPIADGQIILS